MRPEPDSSIPPTDQTSPSHVHTAASRPDGMKSNPEGLIWQSQGLSVGIVNVSTASGRSSRPRTSWVVTISGQRVGPPFVSGASAIGASDDLAYDCKSPAATFDIKTFNRRDDSDSGTREECETIALKQACLAAAGQADGGRGRCDPHRQAMGHGADIQGACEDGTIRVCRVCLQAGQFENRSLPDSVREDHLVPVAIQSVVMSPLPWQRTVRTPVSASLAEIGKALVFGVRPAGEVATRELDLADDSRMDLVAAVEVNPIPVDEFLAGPGGGQAHCVVVVYDPSSPASNPPMSRIEPDGDPLGGDIRPVIADFHRGRQTGTVVHHGPRVDRCRRRSMARSLGQLIEVSPIDAGIPVGAARLEIRLADVVDHVVFLAGNHPRLRGHLAESDSQGAVHSVGIAAIP